MKWLCLLEKPKGCSFVFEFDDRVFASIRRSWTLVAYTAVYEKEQLGLANKPMYSFSKLRFSG